MTSLGDDEAPDIIVTTDRCALEALLSGRMSVGDAVVSERVSLAGDAVKLVQLKRALTGT